MNNFIVGSVVQLNEPDPFEMVSWRDEHGALCAPPSCEMTVKSVDGDQFTAQWFEGDELFEDTFNQFNFHLVR